MHTMVGLAGGGLRFHRSHPALGSSRRIERGKLTRGPSLDPSALGKGAVGSLKLLAPKIPVSHSMHGLNLQNQRPERDEDFPARVHFRCDGGF